MSNSIRDVLGRFVARMGAAAGVRRAADAARVRSSEEEVCDESTIDRRIEDLGSPSDPERAVGELVALGEPALRRLLDVFNNRVSVPRGPSDRSALVGRNRALVRLARRYPDCVLEYFQARNFVSESLNHFLRTSGNRRLEALAAVSERQNGWVKLPEFEKTTTRPRPPELGAPVDRAEIDRWIELLGYSDEATETAVGKLLSFGEPALRRFFELAYGEALVVMKGHPMDTIGIVSNTFAWLTKQHPELALELVRGRPHMPGAVAAAFRQWGDERLKMIGDIALKNNGRVEGLTK